MTFAVLQSVYRNDSPEFLAQSLQSIAENTRLPEKVVLVKDGPLTPGLEAVIGEWQARLPLHVVGYGENRGLAHALNFGLRFVETELVARMDSDDICYADRFARQVIQFEVDGSLAVLGTGIEEFYEDGGRPFRQVRLYPGRTARTSRSLYKGTPLAHPTAMFRTDVLRHFGYREDTRCNEDIDLWFRLLAAGLEIRTLQEPLLRFRITDGTFRRRSLAKAFDEFRIYSRSLRAFNGLTARHGCLLLRLLARLVPGGINRRLYLSAARREMFREDVMRVKSIRGKVFMKGGHLFEALLEVEEDGRRIIKAAQLDCDSDNTVDVPADEVELLRLRDSQDITLNAKDTLGDGTKV